MVCAGRQEHDGHSSEGCPCPLCFAEDDHSGSLAMSPEQILAKGREIDVWAFKYFGGAPLGKAQLLQEYEGYKALSAFQRGNIYEVDTSRVPYLR